MEQELIPKFVDKCFTKCYICKTKPATRACTYDFCLGESYLCDDCEARQQDYKKPRYQDISCAKIIREVDKRYKLSDDDQILNELINTADYRYDNEIVADLLSLVYPKCIICYKAATRTVDQNLIVCSADWVFFCDEHKSTDHHFWENKPEIECKDLEHADIIREAIAFISKIDKSLGIT